jgi:hypothetical protein
MQDHDRFLLHLFTNSLFSVIRSFGALQPESLRATLNILQEHNFVLAQEYRVEQAEGNVKESGRDLFKKVI